MVGGGRGEARGRAPAIGAGQRHIQLAVEARGRTRTDDRERLGFKEATGRWPVQAAHGSCRMTRVNVAFLSRAGKGRWGVRDHCWEGRALEALLSPPSQGGITGEPGPGMPSAWTACVPRGSPLAQTTPASWLCLQWLLSQPRDLQLASDGSVPVHSTSSSMTGPAPGGTARRTGAGRGGEGPCTGLLSQEPWEKRSAGLPICDQGPLALMLPCAIWTG